MSALWMHDEASPSAPPAPAANVTGIPPSGGPLHPSYLAAGVNTQETYAWRPSITSGDSSTLWERNLTNQRMLDMVRNDPHARSVRMKLVDMLVGAGLRVSPMPMARALGLDPKKKKQRAALQDLALQMKSEWKLFAEDPRKFNDSQRRLTMSGQFRLMAGTYATRGEATAYLDWRPEQGARYATCLRVIDPDRLCNPDNAADTIKRRGGIEFDGRGTPTTYYIRQAHLADWYASIKAQTWEAIPRVTETGRPVFIHAFEPEREDQTRAITPFAAVLSRLRMITKMGDLELANAAANALYAAFVSSNVPVGEAAMAMTPDKAFVYADKRVDFYEKNGVPTLNGVRIPVLPIGDEIKMNNAPRQTVAFHHFQTAFLQSVAAAAGITYEQLSMDWSHVNYSSARAALNEVWRHIVALFDAFVSQGVMPIWYGVMEEAFDKGYVVAPAGCPEFWDMPGAYLASRWMGPGRGYVDPVKEAQGASLRMGSMTSTLERECAELGGLDWEDVLDQLALEEEALKARGLVRALSSTGTIVPDPSDTAGTGRDDKPAEKKAA